MNRVSRRRGPTTVQDYAALEPTSLVGDFRDPVLKFALMNKAPREAIRDLVRRGATAAPSTGGTPLHLVAWWGYRPDRDAGQDWTPRDLIRMFVREFGMDPNAPDAGGRPPLWWALRDDLNGDRYSEATAKGLYEVGADLYHPTFNPRSKLLMKMRALKTGVEEATTREKERIIKEAITQQAEATPLDETGRRMTGIPPDVPGPQIVSPYLLGVKEGPQPKRGTPNDRFPGRGRRTQKSTARHRKKSRRTRRH